MQKFEEEKEKKLNVEMSKIMRRHENEKNGLQMKKNSIIDMFNQTKNKNIEQIQKKFGAKMKELKNYQNFEMANFDKITKGITKPCARIQSIVSSTTVLKEDEKDDENEIKGGEEYDEEDEDGEGNNNENQNQNGENGNGEEQENDNNNENNIEGDQQEQEGENEGNDEQNQEEMNDQEEMNEQEHYEQGNEYEEQDENANEEYEEGNMDNEQYQE